MNRSELKTKAKESLKGHYKEAIKLFFLYILVCIGFTVIVSIIEENFEINGLFSFILTLIPTLGVYALYPGFYSFFLKISRNEEVNCKELFKYKNLFLVTIGTSFIASIFSFLGALLFIIPGIIIALSYSMVYFVIVDNPEIGIMNVLRKSKDIMNGHKFDYFVLNLSFIGWYILSYFTLGILLLWLAPYIMVTTANFYNKIKEQN